MSRFVRAHGGIDVAAGKLSVYSELQVRGDSITGYVKPLFRDVSVGSVDGEEGEPKSLGRRLYEGTVGVAMRAFSLAAETTESSEEATAYTRPSKLRVGRGRISILG